MVQFISYDGKYPNLCSGILTLNIDGKIVKFGNSYKFNNRDPEVEYYELFWYSSGFPRLNLNDYNRKRFSWEFNKDYFPKKYLKYFKEITKLFNENVPWGCCGGCL